MAEPVKRLGFGRRAKQNESEQAEELQQLTESLERTKILIHQAYAGFNSVGDAELIESYVYEINALQVRYSYLLRKIKELNRPEAVTADSEQPVLPDAAGFLQRG